MIAAMPRTASRRAVLGLVAGGVLTAVAGCTDAGPDGTDPDQPSEPTDGDSVVQVPDVEALTHALVRAREMEALAESVTDARGERHWVLAAAVTAHREQVRVLTALLEAGGVPLPAEQSSRGSAGPGGFDSLARAAAADVGPTRLAELARVSALNLPVLVSLTGRRGALAEDLGRAVAWQPLEGPTGEHAATLLGAVRPAVYGLQVLAARSSGEERDAFEAPLDRLAGLSRQLTALAGAAAPPPPLGYALDSALSTAGQRDRLATGLFAGLPSAVLTGVDTLSGSVGSVAGTVRLLAETLAMGRPWGLGREAFPGMTVP